MPSRPSMPERARPARTSRLVAAVAWATALASAACGSTPDRDSPAAASASPAPSGDSASSGSAGPAAAAGRAGADRAGADRAGADLEAGVGVAGSAELAARLRAHEIARLSAQLECLGRGHCRPAPPAPVDDRAASALFGVRARAPRLRSAQGMAARAIVEATLGVAASDRAARRRALTFVEDRAVFALDDLKDLFAAAPRGRRAAWLRAARPAAERALDIAAEERAVLEALAARLGTTRGSLLARRAELDEQELRALLGDALAATAPLLGAVADDVTLLPEVVAAAGPRPEPGSRPPALEPTRARGDPVLIDAVAMAAALGRPRPGDERAVLAVRVLVVELRALALASLAVLDGADAGARDALASRILDDAAVPVPGAGALLPADEGGVVVERFVAALRTPAVARALWGGASLDDVAATWHAAPALVEQGFPEAFVEVARVLPELAR